MKKHLPTSTLIKFVSAVSPDTTYIWSENSMPLGDGNVVNNGTFGIVVTPASIPAQVASQEWICVFACQVSRICWVHYLDVRVIE